MRPVISCLRPGRGPGQAINRGTGPSSPAFSCPDPGPAPVGDPGAIHFAAAPEAKTPLALGELLKPPPPQPSGTSGSPKKSQPAAVRARSNRNSPHHTRLGLCIFLPFIRQLATLDFPAVARMVDFAPFRHASHWLALGVLPCNPGFSRGRSYGRLCALLPCVTLARPGRAPCVRGRGALAAQSLPPSARPTFSFYP